ncbi:TetR/AcrR family transcriptional regulator [Cohnella hashimotonis]|uniref:WHG domain-containing protein n=1 Tax=Cohnella hashimotonis TaxID=2826895 RepID=A0ABT6TB51_9BACL|nr:TetR/AcrR family transcriptional regulator [Cohnella hashimotonis]MDI4644062.1 WHG domain-containing protein [Cohnella hashimotonis]
MSPRIGLDRATLLQAATEMADEYGLESVTLSSLAQKLKIRSPSLYNHVKGLPDLRRELALSGLSKMAARFEAVLPEACGDEVLHDFSVAYLDFARQHPGLYEAVQRAPDPEDRELSEAGGQVVSLVVRVIETYGLSGDAAIHAVRGIRSVLHGFVSIERQGGFGMPLDLDVTFRLLVDTFIAGIKALRVQGET